MPFGPEEYLERAATLARRPPPTWRRQTGFLSRAAVESALSSGHANGVKFETTTICGNCHHWAPAFGGSSRSDSPEWQPAAFQAAERSYLKAFRQVELTGPQTWVSSVMRRLRRRVREAEKEKLAKLYEQLSANEHGSALPFGQAHSFVPHQAALSEDQKNMGGEPSADEQVGEEHSFATHEPASSEVQNVEGELSADEQIQEHSFATPEPASSEVQNMGGELSADEQVGEEHSFATREAASSEEQKNVARESVKKDAVAQRMARIMIRVDEIFDDGRHPMVDERSSNKRTHSDSSKD